MESKLKFLRWFGKGAMIVTIITIAQMAWLSDHGQALRNKDISANGIGDLELATDKNIYKLLKVWCNSTAVELQPFIVKLLHGGRTDNNPRNLIEIAQTDIYWDFPFIVFYSALAYILLLKALSFWRLSHLRILLNLFYKSGYKSLAVLSSKKVGIALAWAATIGVLDVLENIAMLYALSNFEDNTVTIILPISFAAVKFTLLFAGIIFILLTFIYFSILLLITSPKNVIERVKTIATEINDPYKS